MDIIFKIHKYSGIVEFDEKRRIIPVEEKDEKPKSNYFNTGLFFLLRQ